MAKTRCTVKYVSKNGGGLTICKNIFFCKKRRFVGLNYVGTLCENFTEEIKQNVFHFMNTSVIHSTIGGPNVESKEKSGQYFGKTNLIVKLFTAVVKNLIV